MIMNNKNFERNSNPLLTFRVCNVGRCSYIFFRWNCVLLRELALRRMSKRVERVRMEMRGEQRIESERGGILKLKWKFENPSERKWKMKSLLFWFVWARVKAKRLVIRSINHKLEVEKSQSTQHRRRRRRVRRVLKWIQGGEKLSWICSKFVLVN